MALRAVLDHPKFSRLRRLLGVPRYAALGCLEGLWHFTSRFTPQGNIGKYGDAEIEAWIEWGGDEGSLITALIEAGWIDHDPQVGLVIHDWPQNADEAVHTDLARKCLLFADGTLPKSGRLNQDERARYTAWVDAEGYEKRPAGRPSNAADMQPKGSQKAAISPRESAENPKPVPVPEPVPEPVPVPEISTNQTPPTSASPPRRAAARSAAAFDPATVVAWLPVIRTKVKADPEVEIVDGHGRYRITQARVDAWTQTYPGISVMQELGEMKEWLYANATKRRTDTGILRFITNWLSKEQDKGGSNGRAAGYVPSGSGRGGNGSLRQFETLDERTKRIADAAKRPNGGQDRGSTGAVGHDAPHKSA